MTNKIIIAAITTIASIGIAHAACDVETCDSSKTYQDKVVESDYHCSLLSYLCSGSIRVATCMSCETGYEEVYGTYSRTDCQSTPIPYTRCQKSSTGGGGTTTPTCYTSNGSTTGNGTGCVEYKKGTTTATRCDSCNDGYTASESYLEMCDGSTSKKYSCTKSLTDRVICEQNQYKRTGITGTTCIDCPSGGTTGLLGGGTAITDCYQPAGTEFTDDAGSGTYNDKCYYSGLI